MDKDYLDLKKILDEKLTEEEEKDYYKRDRKLIAFIESLIDRFKSLERSRNDDFVETFDEVGMHYVIEYLPDNLSRSLKNAISRDRENIASDLKKQASEEKEKIINMIKTWNVEKIYSFSTQYRWADVNNRLSKDKKSKLSVISKVRGKIKDQKHVNKGKIFENESYFSDVIEWINKNFVYRYSKELGPTVYGEVRTSDSGDRTISYTKNDKDGYETFEEEINNRIEESCSRTKELLSNKDFSSEIISKLQSILDLEKQAELYWQLKNILREMYINRKYTNTISVVKNLISYLDKKWSSLSNRVRKIKESIDYDNLSITKKSTDNKDKVKSYKFEDRKQENEKLEQEEPEVEEELKTEVDPEIKLANEEWKKEFLDKRIEYIYGRKPELFDEGDQRLQKARVRAKSELNRYLDELNILYRKLVNRDFKEERDAIISLEFGIDDYVKSQEFIKYCKMSPEERYISDMVSKGKLSSGTTVEELTPKDLETIKMLENENAHLISIYDHIKFLQTEIERYENTFFPDVRKIEDMLQALEDDMSKKNNNNSSLKK